MEDLNYLEKNKALWNSRTEHHLVSDFYDVKSFLAGKSSLNQIELELLGDVKGKSILHLQCHFGQDTISLARMGASVTGVDFSEKAIESAHQLSHELKTSAEFICCDIYSLSDHLNKTFDVVFTSYGTIGWLPDIDKWAQVVAKFLKPGGKFVFAEFHPAVWMFDDNFERVAYSYFNVKPIVETETGTYADRNAPIKHEYVGWNHSIGEVFTSLVNNGLQIDNFHEYDYSPYNCFRNTEEFSPGKFRIKTMENRLPMVYSLRATKK